MKILQKSLQETARKLHLEFVRLGGMRFKLKNKMLAILPEIYNSGIWKKYAGSIVEYAGKYGDIAKTTVLKRLRLEENLGNLPFLKAAIETVGVHKVAMVAKIATPETDAVMAEKLMNMSKMAVQSLSKELRQGEICEGGCEEQKKLDLMEGNVGGNSSQLCKAVSIVKKIELDEGSTFLFMKLKAKFGKNLSDKEFLKIILEEKVEQEFPEAQCEIENSCKTTDGKSFTGDTFTGDKYETRYIPINKKRSAIQQTDGKCIYPNCNYPYAVFHHVDRYSESKNHDSVIPLCKIHHEFAHNNLIRNEKAKMDEWKISLTEPTQAGVSQVADPQQRADVFYREYRMRAIN